jgi:hypothetical protein
VILEPGSAQPGSCLLFWCVFKLSTPRHLKCQMPRQTKPGFFIFEGGSQSKVKFISSPIEIPAGKLLY